METKGPIKSKVVDELIDAFDSKFFKSLGEPVRVQILKFILLNGRADVGTITDHMPQHRSVISRHLNMLHEVGILTCVKEDRHVYYGMNGLDFLKKIQNFADKIEKSMVECCPECFICECKES